MSIPQRMDGYIRVSRVGTREGPGYISPTVQREQIEGWAKLRSVEIGEWHEDFDQSGGKLRRPGLDALLARIESHQTEGVVVARLDRLSRLGVADALKLVERITDAGGSLTAVDLGIDPTTTFGEFALTIMLALGRMERRRISESWAVAKQRAIERGAKVGPTPFGYERDDDGCLRPHPVEGMHIRRAYELAAARGAHAAADYLAEHVPSRRWDTGDVRRQLGRRVYLGENAFGAHINPEAHEALVSPAIWSAAQHERRSRPRAGHAYPLSGIAICVTCGNAMTSGPGSSTRKRRYRCTAAQTLHRGPRCPHPASVAADWLEQYVRETIAPYMAFHIGGADGSEEFALAERVLHEAEGELDAFAADFTLRRALGSRYAEHRALRVEHVEKARAAYAEHAKSAQARERIRGIDLATSTPQEMAELLRGIEASILVTAGRGNDPGRIRIVPFDD
jgi:DNA invertase Pin-like site-specific DNA recombinase